jgi:hypothetical protein
MLAYLGTFCSIAFLAIMEFYLRHPNDHLLQLLWLFLRLGELWLKNNSFSGPIPSEIGMLSELGALHVHSVWRAHCCAELLLIDTTHETDCSFLFETAWLDFSFNLLTSSIPSDLGSLANLSKLSLKFPWSPWFYFRSFVPNLKTNSVYLFVCLLFLLYSGTRFEQQCTQWSNTDRAGTADSIKYVCRWRIVLLFLSAFFGDIHTLTTDKIVVLPTCLGLKLINCFPFFAMGQLPWMRAEMQTWGSLPMSSYSSVTVRTWPTRMRLVCANFDEIGRRGKHASFSLENSKEYWSTVMPGRLAWYLSLVRSSIDRHKKGI